MIYLKCIGVAFILSSAFFISKRYEAFCSNSVKECKQFLSFIVQMRNDLSRFLLPESKMRENIERGDGELGGFFSAYKSGASLIDAFRSALPRLTLPQDAAEALEHLFSDFGRCYMQEELNKLNVAITSLEGIETRLEDEAAVSAKMFKAVIFALALGTVILLL